MCSGDDALFQRTKRAAELARRFDDRIELPVRVADARRHVIAMVDA
jgi:hypothetical protein